MFRTPSCIMASKLAEFGANVKTAVGLFRSQGRLEKICAAAAKFLSAAILAVSISL